MCKLRNYSKIEINGKIIKVDWCLRHLLLAINNGNIETLGSCCGHGKYTMTIVCRNKYMNDDYIFEVLSGIPIPRKKRFYDKDKRGFYYIREVEKIRRRKLK